MPEKLSDEKVDKILSTYKKTKSIRETAEKVGVAKGTVEKYVDRHLKDNEDVKSDTPDTKSNGESAVMEMSGSDSQLADLTSEELMNMSESKFITVFFSEFDNMGIKSSFVEMISNQAQIRGQIPDEDQMSQRIQSHSSGVGNANDANAIAELYWALAQRYLNARGLASPGVPSGGAGMSSMGSSGEWVSAGSPQQPQQQNRQNGNGGGDGGDWVSTGPSPGSRPGQPQRQQPQQQQMQGNGQMAQFAQMMQQMQQQQREMMEKMMQSQQDTAEGRVEKKLEELDQQLNGGGDSVTDSIQEFVELQETLDKLNNSDDAGAQTEEVVGALQQQIQALRQEVADDSGGNQMAQRVAQSDSQMGLLAALAQSGDIGASEMVSVAQQLGEVETDPAVAEKKYEKEIEEMKVEAEQQKWESILDGLEDVASNAGEVVGAFAGGQQQNQQQNQQAQQPQQQESQPQQTENGHVEPETEAEPQQSPAQQIVESGSEEVAEPVIEEAEPEVQEVEEDTNGDGELEVEPNPPEDEAAGTGEMADVDAGAGESEDVEPEPEPEPDDGAECPGCGKEFETERQRNGHLSHCDEVQ